MAQAHESMCLRQASIPQAVHRSTAAAMACLLTQQLGAFSLQPHGSQAQSSLAAPSTWRLLPVTSQSPGPCLGSTTWC
jgi:hypothetical protein